MNTKTKLPQMKIDYQFTKETRAAYDKLPAGVVNTNAHRLGLTCGEPLIIGLDAMIRYARAHEKRFESKLSEDYVLGPLFLDIIKGLRGLLNGDGAVAHEKGVSTDSKDNGACESMFWSAMEIAGFKESDL